jgi:hypothetical protein
MNLWSHIILNKWAHVVADWRGLRTIASLWPVWQSMSNHSAVRTILNTGDRSLNGSLSNNMGWRCSWGLVKNILINRIV